jgi:hypothetical protein
MKKLILLVAILALFAGNANAISWPFDLPAEHNSDLKTDSVAFYSGVDNTIDTSAAFEISYAGYLGFMAKWAGAHATDSASFLVTFQGSQTGDTAYYSWKTLAAAVVLNTAADDSALNKVKTAFIGPDSLGVGVSKGFGSTSALKRAMGVKYLRWLIHQYNENTTNDDSCWIATKLLIKE